MGIFSYGPLHGNLPFSGTQHLGQLCILGSQQRIQPIVGTSSPDACGFGQAIRQIPMLVDPVLSDITTVVPMTMNFQFWSRDSMGRTSTTDGLEGACK